MTRNLVRLLESPPLGASVDCVAIPRSTDSAHRVRQATAIARSLVSEMPAKVAYTYSREFRRRVLKLARRSDYDLFMINGSDLLWLDPLLPPTAPRLLVAHNIEHLLFASQAGRVAALPGVRGWLEHERRRIERFEHEGIRRTRNVIFLSSVDAEHAMARGAIKGIVVPPVFGERVVRHQSAARTGERLELGFLGNLRWWPNKDALSWFVHEVLAQVTRPVILHVFGEGRLPGYVDRGRIVQHGPVADVSQVWDACDLMICPMRSGGGVSIKVAEAVFHGLPTLATPFATRGLPLGDDASLVVRDEADWVSYLNDVDVRAIRGLRAAEEVSQPFTFGANRGRLQEFVRSLASRARTGRPEVA